MRFSIPRTTRQLFWLTIESKTTVCEAENYVSKRRAGQKATTKKITKFFEILASLLLLMAAVVALRAKWEIFSMSHARACAVKGDEFYVYVLLSCPCTQCTFSQFSEREKFNLWTLGAHDFLWAPEGENYETCIDGWNNYVKYGAWFEFQDWMHNLNYFRKLALHSWREREKIFKQGKEFLNSKISVKFLKYFFKQN